METSQPGNPKATTAPPAKPKPTTAPPAPPAKPKPTATKAPVEPPAQPSKNTSAPKLPSSISGSIDATPTSEPNNSNSSSNSSKGFPVPAAAGIAAVGGLIVLLVLTIFLCKWRRARAYAKRDFGHDPSRDPINPNDVLPPEKKPVQEMMEQGLVPQQQHPGSAYQTSNNHIQPPFASQGPETANRGPPGMSRAQPGPAPILTNMPMDGPRSPSRMSPSQRAQVIQQQGDNGQDAMMYRTPRARPQQQPPSEGSQPVLRSDTIGSDVGGQSNAGSMDRLNEGSDVQSEASYRQQQPPVRNQDPRPGNPPSSHPSSYHTGSGLSSPNGPMPQQHGGQSRPYHNGSPYSSPRQAPSHPSPRPNQMSYQLPHPQQPYPQQPYPQPYSPHSPQARPMYGPGPSSPGYPQQRPPYSGGGSFRSPPVSPRGPGYPQSSPNIRPRPGF